MTSRHGQTSEPAQRSYARRFQWLALGIVAVVALYTGGWFVAAGVLQQRAADAVAQASRGGVVARCDGLEARGYPFRIGLFCDRIALADDAQGVSLEAGAFRSAAQIYQPMRIVGELDGPAIIAAPGLGTVTLSWDRLRASTRLAAPLPSRLSVEGGGLSVIREGSTETLATVASFDGHFRTRGDDADLAARFSGLSVGPGFANGGKIENLSGDLDVGVPGGVAFFASGGRGLRGRSFEVRRLALDAGGEAGIAVSGPVSIDAEGLVDATLSVAMRDPARLGALLGEAFPDQRSQIETAFSGLAALSAGGAETPALPVQVAKGRVSIGFISLGDLPPVAE